MYFFIFRMLEGHETLLETFKTLDNVYSHFMLYPLRSCHYPVTFLVNGILSSTNSQSIENPLHSACIRNGGPKAWEKFQISLSNYINCLSSMARDFPEGFLHIHGEIDGFSTACGRIETFNNYLKILVGSIKSCLEPDKHESVDVHMNITLSMARFLCSNINLIKDVFNSTDEQCLNTKMDAVSNCRDHPFFGTNNTIANFSVNEIYSLETMRELKFEFDNRMCSYVQNVEQCVVRVLGECEDQIFLTAVNSFFNYINNDIPCEDLSRTPKSVASQDNSVVNVVS